MSNDAEARRRGKRYLELCSTEGFDDLDFLQGREDLEAEWVMRGVMFDWMHAYGLAAVTEAFEKAEGHCTNETGEVTA
jgi:hypothetical protein